MSCITQLLEMQGDKEFLPVNTHHVIEGGGVYEGYEYIITFTRFGARCGYVAIPDDRVVNEDEIECHGGIIFNGDNHDAKELLPIPCSDVWLGFDCNHGWDGHDIETAKKYGLDAVDFPALIGFLDPIGGGAVRSFGYVEDQCKGIIDQLRAA